MILFLSDSLCGPHQAKKSLLACTKSVDSDHPTYAIGLDKSGYKVNIFLISP